MEDTKALGGTLRSVGNMNRLYGSFLGDQNQIPTLPDKFRWTVATSPSRLNVGLHGPKYKCAKNNTERGRRAKGYRVGVFTTVTQLVMPGSVAS